MLFIDNVLTSAKDVCEKFGLDYGHVVKNPVFKAGDKSIFKDRMTGKIKTNEGTKVRSRFSIRESDGTVVTVQYAETADPKEVGSKSITEYKPRYVGFKGTAFNLRNNIDLAIFFHLNPINSESPVRGKSRNSEKLIKTHDAQKEAKAELTKLDNLEKALVHSSKVDVKAGRLLLKAIKKSSTIDDLSDEEVRVELRNIAHKSPDNYISYVNNRAMEFEGRIRDLVDKKVIIQKTTSGVRQWVWNQGEKDGDFIGGQISNPRDDAKEFLVKHMLNNPEKYAEDVMRDYDSNEVYDKVNSYFDSLDLKSSQESQVGENVIVPSKVDNINIPGTVPEVDNDSLKKWMEDNGYKKITSHVKMLKEGIEAGTIKGDNIVLFASKHFEKAQ